jgi:hypothetical protein
MNGRRRFLGQRDQHASAFSASLLRLCDAVGAPGAAIVDAGGETVDYAGTVDPFDIKVAAAECAVVLARLKACRSPLLASTSELRIRAARKSYVVRALADDYALVLQLLAHSFAVSARGLNEAVREVSFEAGLPVPLAARGKEQWVRVDVRCEPRASRRPSSIWVKGAWLPVEVLGRWMDAGSRDLGYRTRVDSRVELTLIREPMGRWYAEAPLPF